ncbi:MAG: kinase/pyrophosphorylase, partial [Gammaproteobacteria bacterium]|nr:kinase/pyrophosphorylase [Gammaproteobacteria bacterium]
MDKTKCRIFYVSDGTGITATNLGRSLLTQFESVKPEYFTFPYVDTAEKVYAIREKINASAKNSAQRPIIFATLLDSELRRILSKSNALFLDLTGVFIGALEKEFQVKSSLATGLTHGMQGNIAAYEARMRALNFALRYDDGVSSELYERADIILVGASRSGKTPACLYLAMQFGIAAANYPL